MKVLLCTPYNVDARNVGGIAVWAECINAYYHQHEPENVELDIQPMNRSVESPGDLKPLSRLTTGIKDYARLIKRLNKRLANNSYDVLHQCTSATIGLLKDVVVLRMARRHHVATVLHFHSGRVPGIVKNGGVKLILLRKAARLADRMITLDELTKTTLEGMGYHNVSLVPNPCSDTVVSIVRENEGKITRQPRRIFFAGLVIPPKGVIELVEACRDISDCTLVMAGYAEEPMKKRLMEIASSREDGAWLTLLGGIPHEQVLLEMLSSRFFVLPSYTEGLPNVILESMLAGCTIVASTVGAIPALLTPPNEPPCGVLVSPQNMTMLRDALKALLANLDYCDALSEAARDSALQHYTVPNVWPLLTSAWQSAVTMKNEPKKK